MIGHGVLLLSARFKYPVEHVSREQIGKFYSVTNRFARRLNWSAHTVNLLVVTDETANGLMDRIRPALSEITALDDCFCVRVGTDAAGLVGGIHPLAVFLDMAWKHAATKHVRLDRPKRPKPKNLPNAGPSDIRIEDRVEYFPDSALPKMEARASWERKKKPRPDHDEA